ncbi:MAG TPA: ATP-binding protein [Oligoflexus sp.]|uniref:ATP-binding protein n=1 Tax=Oligoflexus sp. TaxID=1971216 RepID=UPI002D7E3F71|nr:ATP-binding protein [Oligoflexus sp.]HET9237119.1 ATP-binding protein [Oligoflexus sp.]
MLIARLALLFFLMGPASAQDQTLTLESIEELEQSMHAAPLVVGKRLEKYLQDATPHDNPRLWLKALFVHMLLFQGDLDAPESMALQKKWMEEAQAALPGIPESREKLEYEMGYLKRRVRERGLSDRIEELDARYEALLKKSRAMQQPTITSRLLGDYAELALNEQKIEKALELSLAALEELNAAVFPEWSLARPSVKSIVALVFQEAGRDAESLRLYQEILAEACEGKDNPYFCNPILTNIAFALVTSKDRETYMKALSYLDRAIKDAERIQDLWTIGIARHKKAHIFYREGQYEATIKLESEAYAIFVKIKETERAVNALIFKAMALNKLKRFTEAMTILDQGEAMLKAEGKPAFSNLLDARTNALVGLKRFEEAFRLLNESYLDMEKMLSERSQKSFSEAAARVGLQLEQEKNKVLERDQKIAELRIQESERLQQFLIMGLLLATLVILVSLWAVLRSREVRLIKNKLQNILDSIDEAILIVGSDLRIRGPVSPFLQHIRQDDRDPVGTDFIESVLHGSMLSQDDCATIRHCLLAMFGEERLAFDLNVAHLPLELVRAHGPERRIYTMHWQPIFDGHHHLRSMIVSMRDVTERKVLEQSMRQEKREHERAAQCLLELSRAHFSRVTALLEQMEAILPRTEIITVSPELLRSIHTCKGVARGLGLSLLSTALHSFEDSVQRNAPEAEGLKESIQVYRNLLKQIGSGQSPTSQEASDLAGVWHHVQTAMKQRLKEEGLSWAGCVVRDDVPRWTDGSLRVLEQCLMHALNNSIDHGFVFPSRRGVKVDSPYFEVAANSDHDAAHIIIRDNGAGLDWEGLRAKAREMNQDPEGDLTEILFMDGFSTAQSVSETSGRGMGLAAIRALCRQQGGDARLRARSDRSGTELHLTLGFHSQQTHPWLATA